MQPPLDLETFAQLSAEIDVGNARDQILTEAGITLQVWSHAQQWWLGRIAAEATRMRYDLTQRYNTAFLAYRKTAFLRKMRQRHVIESKEEAAASRRQIEKPAVPREALAPLMGGQGGVVDAGGPRLTVAQFASLRAELAVYPTHAESIRGRYGFDDASYDLEDQHWQYCFDQDKELFSSYVAYFRHYRDWLLGAASGQT